MCRTLNSEGWNRIIHLHQRNHLHHICASTGWFVFAICIFYNKNCKWNNTCFLFCKHRFIEHIFTCNYKNLTTLNASNTRVSILLCNSISVTKNAAMASWNDQYCLLAARNVRMFNVTRKRLLMAWLVMQQCQTKLSQTLWTRQWWAGHLWLKIATLTAQYRWHHYHVYSRHPLPHNWAIL